MPVLALLAALLLPPGAAAGTQSQVEPYQLVRELLAVQNALVETGRAGLEANRRMIAKVGTSFVGVPASLWSEPRNAAAAVIFTLSGGDPAIGRRLLEASEFGAAEKPLLEGAVAFASGDQKLAQEKLGTVVIEGMRPQLAANIALVQGLLLAASDAAGSMRKLAQARLIAPGTLVEEAAIRAQLSQALAVQDAAAFHLLARQYFQRFPRSLLLRKVALRVARGLWMAGCAPSGIPADVEAWLTRLEPDDADFLALAIAREAILEGEYGLAGSVAQKVAGCGACEPGTRARAGLYGALAAIAQGADAGPALTTLDRASYARRDRELLEAGVEIARQIAAPTQPDIAMSRPEFAGRIVANDVGDEDSTARNILDQARAALKGTDQLLASTEP